MIILSDAGGVAETNCFLIADEVARKAALFDAPDHTVAPLLDEARKRQWDLVGLWLTHGHFDHFADHTVVKSRFPAALILLHEADETKAQHPDLQTRMFGLPFRVAPLKPDGHVVDGQQLKIGGIEVQVLHTPGHAPGHVVYYLPGEHVLVGGDLIIGGSVGRTDFPDSDPMELAASIERVMKLPGKTRLLGGHGPVTTLDEERRTNPFVREILGEFGRAS